MFEREKDLQKYVEQLEGFLEREDLVSVQSMLRDFDDHEIAEVLDMLEDAEKAARILAMLDSEIAADTLMELYPETREKVVDYLSKDNLAKFLEELPSDEAADLVGELEKSDVPEILKKLPEEEREELQQLTAHHEDSAGSLMAHEVEHLPGNYTVAQAIADLVRFGKDIEEVFHIFITDEDEKLIGVIPLQRLLIVSPNLRLSKVADEIDTVVRVDMDKEHVADMFRRKDIVSAPVVDAEGRLLGRITIDDILDVVDDEASEDFYRMVGINVAQDETAVHHIRTRLSWFAIAFAGELAAGLILAHFAKTFESTILLVSFLPVIMAIGGNSGVQSAAVMIRRIALSRWGHLHHKAALGKEILTGFLLGLCAAVLLLASGALFGEVRVGAIAALSALVATTASVALSAYLPVLYSRYGADPAFATFPFIATISDLFSIALYAICAVILL